jgi:hypothetical protein
MSRIVEMFNSYFETWAISLPPESVHKGLPGAIFQRGWGIQCCFGADARGRYMDFYAANRLTNDRHVRIYESGNVESLPAISDFLHENWQAEYEEIMQIRARKFPVKPQWDGSEIGWETGKWVFMDIIDRLIVKPGIEVHDCMAKVLHFCQHDAYAGYDVRGYAEEDQPDVVTSELLTVMNSAMRARSKRAAWDSILGQPLTELSAIPVDADLIETSDEEWPDLRDRLHDCLCRLAQQPWITDMAATKVLYLKRPRLVAISDSYIRRALDIPETKWSDFKDRGHYYAARGVAVAESLRRVGRDNMSLLYHIQKDAAKAGFRLSKARIIDILVWVDMALANDPPHQMWHKKALACGWNWIGKNG